MLGHPNSPLTTSTPLPTVSPPRRLYRPPAGDAVSLLRVCAEAWRANVPASARTVSIFRIGHLVAAMRTTRTRAVSKKWYPGCDESGSPPEARSGHRAVAFAAQRAGRVLWRRRLRAVARAGGRGARRPGGSLHSALAGRGSR